MTSWWRLRTQAYLVLVVLLSMIVFLGVYARREAKRHVIEADELLGANFAASSILKEIENAETEALRTAAKFRVTQDPAYQLLAQRQNEKINGLVEQLRTTIATDAVTGPAVAALKATDYQSSPAAFAQALRETEKRLESQRLERSDRLRRVAKDLDKIISVTFLIAIALTSWLGAMLYLALLKPLDSIKRAARRIREGELSYRIENFQGFAELAELRREFNTMAIKLEELDRMKADFLSTVSHELRTPLTALKEGLAFLAEKQGTVPPALAARTLEVCNQSAKRLETMIQNLLNHAKMDSGFYSFDERPKDFVAVVESVIQGLKPIAERRGMKFDLKLASGRPMASFSVEGITHALENLLLNATKYGESGHAIRVEVSRLDLPPVPQLEVRVTNRGRGLLPSELKLIFERFFRASNADGQKGVGLGLSVVKRIIEAHHGMVTAESEGGITTFWFRIPQRYESAATARALPAEGPRVLA